MKVALVYDRINKWGGAERVLEALHELYPDAPLYTSVYHPQTAAWADKFRVITSYLQRIPGASKAHEYLAVFMPSAFEQFTFDEYDLVISVTSEAAKGIITKPHTKHICYCLTPTRYLWSGHDAYFSSWLKLLASPAISYLRTWDSIAGQRPDGMIGISLEVQRRIKTYYGRDSHVVYPPVRLLRRDHENKVALPQSPYFLIVSRLVPYKRIDIAIRACNKLNLPLIIIGNGSEKRKLQQLAGPTIRFVGNLTDSEVAEYYEQCQAFLFPGDEDFGITVVEAQSFGKPVIAFKKGGALETILEDKTGIFFPRQTVESMLTALQQFREEDFSSEACRNQAKKFTDTVFKKSFVQAVDQLCKKA